ncbi:MAG: 4-alpha-glucanotransferase, partial [Acidimicrobiia bacterium]|nr:4-alpha-glucanotransferase [Acidimicrobiia bacterium]
EYGDVIPWKTGVLDAAYDRFVAGAGIEGIGDEFEQFKSENATWLDDFALFMAIKEENELHPWTKWEPGLRLRDPAALDEARSRLGASIDRQAFRQFLFFRQWFELRWYAGEHDIKIIGDIPIYVASDSADAWAHPHLFEIDEQGEAIAVAGVPPDYFSPTGQLWGNPLYRWDVLAEGGFEWWLDRLASTFALYDIVRIDHFRAFADYWRVPAGSETAETGTWLDGPGIAFFDAVRQRFGDLAIIAEDLGELSPKVPALIEATGLPSMKVLQFGFSTDLTDPFIPDNYPENCVVYVGTHDNDTAVGWYESAPKRERHFARKYLGSDGTDIAWDLIDTAWQSRAVLAGATLQDILGLGTEARMNTPSVPGGQWQWRFEDGVLSPDLAKRLRDVNHRTHRV